MAEKEEYRDKMKPQYKKSVVRLLNLFTVRCTDESPPNYFRAFSPEAEDEKGFQDLYLTVYPNHKELFPRGSGNLSGVYNEIVAEWANMELTEFNKSRRVGGKKNPIHHVVRGYKLKDDVDALVDHEKEAVEKSRLGDAYCAATAHGDATQPLDEELMRRIECYFIGKDPVLLYTYQNSKLYFTCFPWNRKAYIRHEKLLARALDWLRNKSLPITEGLRARLVLAGHADLLAIAEGKNINTETVAEVRSCLEKLETIIAGRHEMILPKWEDKEFKVESVVQLAARRYALSRFQRGTVVYYTDGDGVIRPAKIDEVNSDGQDVNYTISIEGPEVRIVDTDRNRLSLLVEAFDPPAGPLVPFEERDDGGNSSDSYRSDDDNQQQEAEISGAEDGESDEGKKSDDDSPVSSDEDSQQQDAEMSDAADSQQQDAEMLDDVDGAEMSGVEGRQSEESEEKDDESSSSSMEFFQAAAPPVEAEDMDVGVAADAEPAAPPGKPQFKTGMRICDGLGNVGTLESQVPKGLGRPDEWNVMWERKGLKQETLWGTNKFNYDILSDDDAEGSDRQQADLAGPAGPPMRVTRRTATVAPAQQARAPARDGRGGRGNNGGKGGKGGRAAPAKVRFHDC